MGLSENLWRLRKLHKLSQEKVADEVGVSRQAVAKWENGETTPEINSCIALARLYGVSLDDLVNYNEAAAAGLPVPPRGKHIFGAVTVGEKGQIVIPKKARDVFAITPGDQLMVLGDEGQGLALIKEEAMVELLRKVQSATEEATEGPGLWPMGRGAGGKSPGGGLK